MIISNKKLRLLRTIPSLLLLLLVLINAPAYADYQTNLLPGELIQDGASDLNAGGEAVPIVYDWDDDGRKDLLVGSGGWSSSPAPVKFYKNQGTDDNPSFNGFTLVQACNNFCDLSVPGSGN